MPTFDCPDCAHTGPPADVETATIVDGVVVTCADCGTRVVKPVAFASAARERHRQEVDR